MPGGWVLVLCGFLLVWRPLNYAAELAGALPSLGIRGAPAIVEVIVHGFAAALAVAGGWSLWTASPHGPVLARAAVIASAVVSVQSLYWSALPSQIAPGDHLPLAVLAVAHAAAWLAYLQRSRRVRALSS